MADESLRQINGRFWDADGNHMDKDVFRRGLGELTDVYEIDVGKAVQFKINTFKVIWKIARAEIKE